MATPLELVVRSLLYAGLVALVFVPLEHLAPLRPVRRTSLKTDALFATVGLILTRGGILVLSALTLVATESLSLEGPLFGLPTIAAVPLGLLYFELAGYAYHRLAHRVPVLWRFHEVHHSSTAMDWLAGFRQHPLEIMLMTLTQNLPLVLLGLPLGEHAIVILLLRLNTIFVHSNLRTPAWLGVLVATPVFHHRHHDRDRSGANYATLFPWIDRLFGTLSTEQADTFGVSGTQKPTPGFWSLLTAPLKPRAPGDL